MNILSHSKIIIGSNFAHGIRINLNFIQLSTQGAISEYDGY